MEATSQTDRAERLAEEESLLDRGVIVVSSAAYAALLARLSQPPAPNERLRKTMQTPAPWDGERG